MEEAFRRVPRAEIFERTGIQFMQLNSLYQLLAMAQANSPAMAAESVHRRSQFVCAFPPNQISHSRGASSRQALKAMWRSSSVSGCWL